jgi:hypothetical protein
MKGSVGDLEQANNGELDWEQILSSEIGLLVRV